MKKVRLLATTLFYITRTAAIPYLLTALYCVICFVLGTVQYTEGGERFIIHYPFTQKRYLLGDSTEFYYIFEMIAFIGLYGVFFWLLGTVFDAFRQPRLFTEKNVGRLKLFYTLNFIVPLPFLIGHLWYSYEVSLLISLTFLHFVIGIFAYFMAAIFEQGLNLQAEQDLYI
ncbi:DUF2975 domain-containing protein [Flavobacterium cerinum]|uniref:DUF2975 domain-containing protein n=1 Tax=Flavobacterium cerinum TaxID=2502784 RepID=A0ABY5ILY5_9FLAO|nr:DUF2975 domain-containing protein [Flavobacterium cerinum]UUC43846.1 DUF2975 domain-containing protein [Flavobacterium cerinum]